MKIRLIELFAGIGAFSAAFRNLGIPHETIAIAEIDSHAIRAYTSIHGDIPNLGDISLVENLPDCDLLTYSFPCQDISLAGQGKGFAKSDDEAEQTRSGLLWEVERLLLKTERRPKYLIMENVDAILNTNHIRNFQQWIRSLTKMGYTSSYAILNACDYGVPQNRKRCFMVSALGPDRLVFPQPCPDGRLLKDVLEDDVPEKYYLSEKAMEGLKAHKARHDAKGHGFGFKITDPEREIAGTVKTNAGWRNTDTFIEDLGRESQAELMHVANLPTSYETAGRVYSANGLSPTINTCDGGDRQPKILTRGALMENSDKEEIMIRNATKEGYMIAHEWGGVVLDSYEARGRVQPGKSPTIMTGAGTGTVTPDLRIRRLTPLECWRLQGFRDDDYQSAVDAGVSPTQLYKQAGNSIAVPVIEHIFRAMFIDKTWIRAPTLSNFAKSEEVTE